VIWLMFFVVAFNVFVVFSRSSCRFVVMFIVFSMRTFYIYEYMDIAFI
jgi:hypothetical protein